jgi:soluble lytic murein transglycosylase
VTRTSRQSQARRRAILRRRLAALVGVAALVVLGTALIAPVFDHAVKDIVLPLRHEDIIRQQSHDKRLDPSLVAALIYTESRFRDQTSGAGAKGLMQITPGTAKFIERLSGGTTFELADLSSPQVNISYGTFYLRYLLDRYGENEALALAAYNGGEGNVDRWVNAARQKGRALSIDAIPFGETRAYVRSVQSLKREYRREYRAELGL